MLAYVFWHWRRAEIATVEYEARQRAFHAALAAARPAGFHGSFSVALRGAPWAAGGDDAYEDWYLTEDFTALGTLNVAAVSGSRAAAHDPAASAAAGGAGGVYQLRRGAVLHAPRHARWFAKPAGMTYDDLSARLASLVDDARGALWMRQLVLGPAGEFCVHTTAPVSLPPPFAPLAVPLRTVWPESPGGRG